MSIDVTLSSGGVTLKTSLSRPVLSEIKLVADIPNRNAIQVGQEIPVSISVQRTDGTIVDTWDMPLTLGIKGGNAKLTQTKLTFVKGKANTNINTGTRS